MNESKIMIQDPVCGRPVDEATALYDIHDGETFYFCGYFCRHEFFASRLGASIAEKSESIHG